MNIYDAIFHTVLLALCVYLVGLWQREKGKAIGWNNCLFDHIRHEKNRRDHHGKFKLKDAPTHTWRAAK